MIKKVVLLNYSLVMLIFPNGALLENKLNQQISREKTHLLNLSTGKIGGKVPEARKVSDYFVQTPDQYFKAWEDDQGNVSDSIRARLLQQSSSIVDQGNGYISTSSIYPDLCNYEMTIFRRSFGSHLVALNVGCTIGDRLYIIDPDKNWRDVTAEVFPIEIPIPSVSSRFFISLPRYGRTIIITNAEDDVVIAKVFFDGDNFQVE
ncbi:MAG: hypothetical protein AB4062_14110 [Crocosphaera sp.]